MRMVLPTVVVRPGRGRRAPRLEAPRRLRQATRARAPRIGPHAKFSAGRCQRTLRRDSLWPAPDTASSTPHPHHQAANPSRRPLRPDKARLAAPRPAGGRAQGKGGMSRYRVGNARPQPDARLRDRSRGGRGHERSEGRRPPRGTCAGRARPSLTIRVNFDSHARSRTWTSRVWT